MPTRQVSEWKDGFLFIGNHLALDFVNTRPVRNGEPTELLPDFAALLRWFQAAGLLSSSQVSKLHEEWKKSSRARQTLKNLRKLREELRAEVVARESGKTAGPRMIASLNRLMSRHPMLTRLKAAGRKYQTELWFEQRQPEDLFAPLAHSAAVLLTDTDRSRLRKCAHCVLHFYDTSKKGTRRWCSMNLCGNRLKVAAYADRRRLHSHSEDKPRKLPF